MIFRLLAAVILAVPLVYFVHSLFKYTRMIGNIFLSLVYRPVVEAIESTRGEKISILDTAGHEIEGLFLKTKHSRRVLVFCPESGADKASWEKYAYFAPDLGFSVLSLDVKAPGITYNGKDLSQWPCRPDVERVLTAVRWAKKACGAGTQVVLFGVSNGSDIALAAAQQEPAVRGVIADGLFSMREIFRDYIRRWAPMLVKPAFIGERLPKWIVNMYANLGFWYAQKEVKTRFVDVETLLQKTTVPVLMIHGQKDDIVPETHQNLLRKIAQKKYGFRAWSAEAAEHNQSVIVARSEYEKQIRNFLEMI